jgi:hypothetical protein
MTAELERFSKWPGQIAVLSQHLFRGADANHAGPQTLLAGAPTKIRTGNLSNKRLERYLYANPLQSFRTSNNGNVIHPIIVLKQLL